MKVNSWFSNFHKSIYMSSYITDKVKTRYEAITKRINQEYWDSDSNVSHSFYAGSYGRGTEIYASDIDVVVELPDSVKTRFDRRLGNKQSQLLSEVKEKLQKTYSTSKLSLDGQVIVIEFTDGIRFEIVPAFKLSDGKYYYPDTNYGGSWEIMDPKKEIESFGIRHKNKNYTMKKFCRMIRCWREKYSISMNGELLDSIVYKFYENAKYVEKYPFLYFDFITRDFFLYLSKHSFDTFYTPGTYRLLKIKYPLNIAEKAELMYEKANDAISKENDMPYTAQSIWREIYGKKF